MNSTGEKPKSVPFDLIGSSPTTACLPLLINDRCTFGTEFLGSYAATDHVSLDYLDELRVILTAITAQPLISYLLQLQMSTRRKWVHDTKSQDYWKIHMVLWDNPPN